MPYWLRVGGARPPPFITFTLQQSCSVRSSWVGRNTNPVSTLVKICTLWFTPTSDCTAQQEKRMSRCHYTKATAPTPSSANRGRNYYLPPSYFQSLFLGWRQADQLLNWCSADQLLNWWSADQLLNWWSADQLLNWWSADQLLNCWSADQLLNWWSADQLLNWWSADELLNSRWPGWAQLLTWRIWSASCVSQLAGLRSVGRGRLDAE